MQPTDAETKRKTQNIIILVFLITTTLIVFGVYKLSAVDTSHQNEPQTVTTRNITISNTNVKKVNGKYRYFFELMNNDTAPYSGTVNISFVNIENDTPLPTPPVTITRAVASKEGYSFYIDLSTGTPSVHGQAGLVKFVYEVSDGSSVVSKNEGRITDPANRY